jgi:hypothetical protein
VLRYQGRPSPRWLYLIRILCGILRPPSLVLRPYPLRYSFLLLSWMDVNRDLCPPHLRINLRQVAHVPTRLASYFQDLEDSYLLSALVIREYE